MTDRIRIGTRGSRLALVQAEWVAERLRAIRPEARVEIVTIRTEGDRVLDRPLSEIGGKGLFLKEIEEALLDGRVDVGVHSMKDVPAELPKGLEILAVPERGDPGDVLVSSRATLRDLPAGTRLGTSSLRRAALVRDERPEIEIVPIRGNVETRLRKWRDGEVDALVLARAGLDRLELHVPEARPLPVDRFVPAIGQGALAIEGPSGSPFRSLLSELHHARSGAVALAERAVLRVVSGDCRTPVAAHAVVRGDTLELRAVLASPDGSRVLRTVRSGPLDRPEDLGTEAAEDLLSRGGRALLEEIFA